MLESKATWLSSVSGKTDISRASEGVQRSPVDRKASKFNGLSVFPSVLFILSSVMLLMSFVSMLFQGCYLQRLGNSWDFVAGQFGAKGPRLRPRTDKIMRQERAKDHESFRLMSREFLCRYILQEQCFTKENIKKSREVFLVEVERTGLLKRGSILQTI